MIEGEIYDSLFIHILYIVKPFHDVRVNAHLFIHLVENDDS